MMCEHSAVFISLTFVLTLASEADFRNGRGQPAAKVMVDEW